MFVFPPNEIDKVSTSAKFEMLNSQLKNTCQRRTKIWLALKLTLMNWHSVL